MMTVEELHRLLGDALEKLREVTGLEDRATAAQRKYEQFQHQHAALIDAHAKVKEDSDAHLAENLAKLNDETAVHAGKVEDLKKQRDQLEVLHREQEEKADNTLSSLNTRIGTARKELAEWETRRDKVKNDVLEIAKSL